MKPDPIAEQRNAIVEECVNKLGEYCDAVQILVTWQEQSTTQRVAMGAGNWYARQGMAHEFINKDIAQENARQISESIGPGIMVDFDDDDFDDDDDMEELGSA